MSTLSIVAAATLTAFLIVVGLLYLNAQTGRPAVYHNLSLVELQPFLRSWGAWLSNRGVIQIGHPKVTGTAQFRKCIYKRQPNTLVFRYRNADDSRRNFPVIQASFDAAKIAYNIELTRSTRKPRALEVVLDPVDVFMPTAATNLIATVFGSLGVQTPNYFIWSEGRVQSSGDRADIPMIPNVVAMRAGYRVSATIARIQRLFQSPVS